MAQAQESVLGTDADLYRAILFQTPVAVYFLGIRYEPSVGHRVEAFTDEHVVVGGQFYARRVCEVRTYIEDD